LLLREVEKRTGILRRLATCFTDYRNPDLIEHGIEELVAQRVYGLAKDLNDHDELRKDPLLAVLVEKSDPSETLAAKSPLNRLELTRATASAKERYKKIVLDHAAVGWDAGGCVSAGACASTAADHSGLGCVARSAVRKAGRVFLSRYRGGCTFCRDERESE
jgi:hypothetical protein